MYLGGLCFITDRRSGDLTYEEMCLAVLRSGVKWIQYRDKDRTRGEFYNEALMLRRVTRDFNAILVINDHSDIAIAVDADGVHLGQDDLPLKEARRIMGRDRIIGISTHSLEQAIEAERGGADYIGFGPLFHTITKDAGAPRGISMLREVKEKVHIPVIAIGGINLTNLESVLDAGADAIAVATGILKGDITENTNRFMDIIRKRKWQCQ
ncbi:MAG: thiamine phosphate synthase [Nitrospirae bacterium]|nr:thiamine phosphate synthase [Nitrospirota bacterium]